MGSRCPPLCAVARTLMSCMSSKHVGKESVWPCAFLPSAVLRRRRHSLCVECTHPSMGSPFRPAQYAVVHALGGWDVGGRGVSEMESPASGGIRPENRLWLFWFWLHCPTISSHKRRRGCGELDPQKTSPLSKNPIKRPTAWTICRWFLVNPHPLAEYLPSWPEFSCRTGPRPNFAHVPSR